MAESTTHQPRPSDALTSSSIDDEAWLRELVTAHSGVLRRIAATHVGPDEADDVISVSFATAWRERASFDPRLATERAWLVGIVLNRCRSMGRAHRRWQRRIGQSLVTSGVQSHTDDSINRLDAGRLAPILVRALEALPSQQREVLLLVAVGELEPNEVAVALGMPPATVRSHLLRARRAIGDVIKTEGAAHG